MELEGKFIKFSDLCGNRSVKGITKVQHPNKNYKY